MTSEAAFIVGWCFGLMLGVFVGALLGAISERRRGL